jgi:superfamily II DNA or RNA helicase
MESETTSETKNNFPKTLNTYLGQKGYTILKKELTVEQHALIRKELTAKPYTPGTPGMGNQSNTFPVYRESNNKFYVPRYYGIDNFGPPKSSRISEGDDIDIKFAGELRDNQKPVVKTYLEHVETSAGGGLLELPCAFGKTCLALHICSQLKKKSLIIVHKEFLMNQWIERIQQFLPGARVGKIQGQTVDIENKDIVIGMLQSLSMKDYHESTFDSFGLTIIDEVHHISSEVFSCALFKIVTKYTLGLSATMNRKDGTTKVFKMFLGEVVFKGKRDEEHSVVVRAIEYVSNDEDFKTVATDFRGNVQYSTIISKLCVCNHRSEFILRVISDMLNENPAQQIMILAHNRNLLTYFHDAIKSRNIASVGYYVGGMKEVALKESESKKIVIASFAMASEGLDIKTLTTLIMATPKTDIEQSVGRILRERHGNPVVVDIIDEHQPFKNQWTKRKAFYKKQNYKIIQTTSTDYDPDIRFWKHVSLSNKKEKPCPKSDDALLDTCFIKFPKK